MTDDLRISCAGCGADTFTVTHEFTLVKTITASVPCSCEADADPSTKTATEQTYMREWGPLDEDGQPRFEDREDDGTDVDTESEIACEPCFAAGAEDEDNITVATEVDSPSERYRLQCEACKREVEFVWSHPDRGGPAFRASWRDRLAEGFELARTSRV